MNRPGGYQRKCLGSPEIGAPDRYGNDGIPEYGVHGVHRRHDPSGSSTSAHLILLGQIGLEIFIIPYLRRVGSRPSGHYGTRREHTGLGGRQVLGEPRRRVRFAVGVRLVAHGFDR